MDKNSAAILRAAEAAAFTVDHIGDRVVRVFDPKGYGLNFYRTSRGWLHARKDGDGRFTAPTSVAYRLSKGVGMASHEDIETLAGMGPLTYATAANAIRAKARPR